MITQAQRSDSNYFKEMIAKTNALRAAGGLPPCKSIFAHRVIPEDAQFWVPFDGIESIRAAVKSSSQNGLSNGRHLAKQNASDSDASLQKLIDDREREVEAIVRQLEEKAEQKDRPFVKAWHTNEGDCQSKYPTFDSFAAHMRYLKRLSE